MIDRAIFLKFLLRIALLAGLTIPMSSAYAVTGDGAVRERETISFCSKTRTVIVSGASSNGKEIASTWSPKQLAEITNAFQTAAKPLCDNIIKASYLADYGPIHFFDNPDANIISIFNEDLGYGPKVITVEIPSLAEFDNEGLASEMRRALLCAYDPDADELDETACLPD